MLKKALTTLTIGIACLAATGQDQPAAPAKPAESSVIVRVVGRDSTITVRAGSTAPTYSVENKSGQQMVAPATLDTLQAQQPEVARKVQAMQAGAWAGLE